MCRKNTALRHETQTPSATATSNTSNIPPGTPIQRRKLRISRTLHPRSKSSTTLQHVKLLRYLARICRFTLPPKASPTVTALSSITFGGSQTDSCMRTIANGSEHMNPSLRIREQEVLHGETGIAGLTFLMHRLSEIVADGIPRSNMRCLEGQGEAA